MIIQISSEHPLYFSWSLKWLFSVIGREILVTILWRAFFTLMRSLPWWWIGDNGVGTGVIASSNLFKSKRKKGKLLVQEKTKKGASHYLRFPLMKLLNKYECDNNQRILSPNYNLHVSVFSKISDVIWLKLLKF